MDWKPGFPPISGDLMLVNGLSALGAFAAPWDVAMKSRFSVIPQYSKI